MSEDNLRHIPTLEDVVETREQTDSSVEDSIRIVATEDDVLDDAFDDEFNKLFEADTQAQTDDKTDDLWERSASEPSPSETTADIPDIITLEPDDDAVESDISAQDEDDAIHATDQASGATEETADITLTAETDSVQIADTEDSSEGLWIEDWQEEAQQSIVTDQAFSSLSASNFSATEETQDDIDISEQLVAEADSAIEAPETIETVTETVAAAPVTAPVDTAKLVNQIVSEIMPEIEWKLRNKIREVLDEQFPADD